MFSSSTLVYSLSLFPSLSLLFFLFFLSPHILLSSSNLISTADDLDDLSLFHRAAVSSSTNNRRLISLSPNPPPKIAFLFLTNSDLTFLPVWESFFQGHQDVYIHADPTSFVSPLLDSSSINAKFIPAKRTARASPTLISAERRLLANAILDDPNNLYFALISQYCIPLHSFSYIHNHLFSTNSDHHQSFIEILSDEPFLPKLYNARGSVLIRNRFFLLSYDRNMVLCRVYALNRQNQDSWTLSSRTFNWWGNKHLTSVSWVYRQRSKIGLYLARYDSSRGK